MRVETRAYFAVYSDELSPEQLAERIGLTPSSVMRKAAKSTKPLRPVMNAWKLDSGLGLNAPTWDHLEALCALVTPVTGPIAELCQGEPRASLAIVRKFFPAVGEASLGLWIDEPWMAILRETGAGLDMDEYDYTAE